MKCAACGRDVEDNQITWSQGSGVCPKCAGKGRAVGRVMIGIAVVGMLLIIGVPILLCFGVAILRLLFAG